MYCKEITAEQAAKIRESHKATQTEEAAKDYFISEIAYAATGGWQYTTIHYTSIKGMSKEALIAWLQGLGYIVTDNEYSSIEVRW